MASLAEEVIIIIHVLTLCCIGVSVVCDEAVGDGFLPTTMPATEAAGKPFPSGAENLTTNMNSSGSLEVSFSTDEGREEEEGGKGKENIIWTKQWWQGERRRKGRMAEPDDEWKILTRYISNITLIEIKDEMENGTERNTATEERANHFVECNFAGLQEAIIMDKESEDRQNSQDTSTGTKKRYIEFEDGDKTTQSKVELLLKDESLYNKGNRSSSNMQMLIMTHLPKECYTSQWSESLVETFFDNLRGIRTHWLQKYNDTCYGKLNSCHGVKSFSKTIPISPTDRLLLISPNCVPSSGLFLHQVFQGLLDFLPESCSLSLCKNSIWMDITRLPLIYMDLSTSPKSSNNKLLIEDCYKKLLEMFTNSISISESLPQEKIDSSTKDVSDNSKCDSVVMVKVMKGKRNLVLIVSQPGCPSTSAVWFFTQTTKLFSILKGKALITKLNNNIYNAFFYFLDKDMSLFKLPDSCISLLGNEHVDLTAVTLPGRDNVRLWLPYVKYCSGQLCRSLNSTFSECDFNLSAKRHLWFTPHSNPIISVLPQCLKYSLDAKQVKLKAEIIGRITIENNDVTQDCLNIICDASVLEKGDSTAFIFVEKYPTEYFPNTCLYKPHETITISDSLTLVSYHLNNTNFTLVYVYLVYYNYRKERFREFVANFYNANELEMITCCNSNPYDVNKYKNDGKVFYTCIAKTSPPIPPFCDENENHRWYTKKVGNNSSNIYIVILKNGTYLEGKQLYLWLATLDIDFSNESLAYLFPLIESIEFKYGWNNIIRFTEKERTSVGFQSFINDIQRADAECDQSKELTVCYKRGTKFPITQPNPRYIIIFHECVINPFLGEDQLILALFSHFHDTGITNKELCDKEHHSVAITTANKVEYETLGFPNEVVPILNELKSSSPEWTWVEEDYHDPWFVADWFCLRLWEISHISYMLSAGGHCLYYTTSSVKVFMFIIRNHTSHVALYPLISSSALATSNLTGKYESKSLVLEDRNSPSHSHALQIIKTGFNPLEGSYMFDYDKYPEKVLQLQRRLLKISLYSLVTGNEKCYDDIKSNKFLLISNNNIQAMGPIPNNVAESSCFSSLPRRIKEDMMYSPAHNNITSVTINKFWPTCLYNMMMFITGVNGTFVTDWWYLGPSCKRQEILLLVSSISVTVLTLAGNIFVLTVIVTSGLLQDSTFMIRASLAFADLLMGLIPASLAVYDQFGLMNGRLTLRNLNEDILLTNIPYIIDSQSPGFQQLRFQRKGFLPILACFSFNVSTMVSLLTLAILSLERLCVMRGRPLSRAFMLRSIILSWVAGLLLSFLVNWRKEGIDFTGYFDPITKLTLNIGANAYSVSRWVFYLEICVMGLAGTTVVVCGTATLILYILHHRLTKAVLTIHSCNRDVELRRTTIIFALMVGIFTITVGLVIIDVFADLAVTKPLAHWLIWWVFVAASSWNWALYTLSGGRFRVQIRSLLSCGRIRRSQPHCEPQHIPFRLLSCRRVQHILSFLSCGRIQLSQKQPHCSPQHISFGSSMFHGMFRKKEALLQVELTSISNTHKGINKRSG